MYLKEKFKELRGLLGKEVRNNFLQIRTNKGISKLYSVRKYLCHSECSEAERRICCFNNLKAQILRYRSE